MDQQLAGVGQVVEPPERHGQVAQVVEGHRARGLPRRAGRRVGRDRGDRRMEPAIGGRRQDVDRADAARVELGRRGLGGGGAVGAERQDPGAEPVRARASGSGGVGGAVAGAVVAGSGAVDVLADVPEAERSAPEPPPPPPPHAAVATASATAAAMGHRPRMGPTVPAGREGVEIGRSEAAPTGVAVARAAARAVEDHSPSLRAVTLRPRSPRAPPAARSTSRAVRPRCGRPPRPDPPIATSRRWPRRRP